jgi:hypothetical protein
MLQKGAFPEKVVGKVLVSLFIRYTEFVPHYAQLQSDWCILAGTPGCYSCK